MTSAEYSDLIRDFSKLCTLDQIHTQCCALCEQFGFEKFIYGVKLPTSFIKPHLLIISGYPKEWRERYDAQGYLKIDPVVSYCAGNLTPLTWDQLEPFEKQNQAVRQFMNESRDFGLKSGIGFPIHDPQGGRAMLSLVSRKEQHCMHPRIMETLPFAQAISFHIHEAVRRTLNTVEIFPGRFQVSARETECLRWTAEGKTSWETSKILGISERTVIFHLQKVSDKLQVSNRSQAVARAVSLGMIR